MNTDLEVATWLAQQTPVCPVIVHSSNHERVESMINELRFGSRISAPDTVPICLWLAARHLHDFREALWATVSISGDLDTNCAIVGGIVALSVGIEGIPAEWLSAREVIPLLDLQR